LKFQISPGFLKQKSTRRTLQEERACVFWLTVWWTTRRLARCKRLRKNFPCQLIFLVLNTSFQKQQRAVRHCGELSLGKKIVLYPLCFREQKRRMRVLALNFFSPRLQAYLHLAQIGRAS